MASSGAVLLRSTKTKPSFFASAMPFPPPATFSTSSGCSEASTIVDRTLEHPGYGDRAILLLRKMIRDGIAEVANGGAPRGVLKEDLSMVDLDIGVEEYPVGQVPEPAKGLIAELQQQSDQI